MNEWMDYLFYKYLVKVESDINDSSVKETFKVETLRQGE